MTNKFNINQELFYIHVDIRNYKEFKPILVRVVKIELIEINIIYTVKFISSIGWNIEDRNIRNLKEINENCLYSSLDVLKVIHEKAVKKS